MFRSLFDHVEPSRLDKARNLLFKLLDKSCLPQTREQLTYLTVLGPLVKEIHNMWLTRAFLDGSRDTGYVV